MKKRIVALLTCIALILSVTCFSFDAEAASAKSILNKAYKTMKKYDTIFYYFHAEYKDNGVKGTESDGFSISDTNISHTFSDYEEWHIKSRKYTRYGSTSSWSVEKTENDNKSPKKYYGKKYQQYCLSNLENPTIKKTDKSFYIIYGKDPTGYYEAIEYKINKKNNFVMQITYHCEDSSYTDENGVKHTVTDQKWILDNVCYGYGKLKAPKILK